MIEKIFEDMTYNFLIDFKKKGIDKRTRATILRRYMNQHKLSKRAMAKEIGIPHSTIQDWLLIEKLSEEEYEALKAEGHNDTAIYRTLRNNKSDMEKVPLTVLALREATHKTKQFYRDIFVKTTGALDPDTAETIKELVNILNRLLIKSERS